MLKQHSLSSKSGISLIKKISNRKVDHSKFYLQRIILNIQIDLKYFHQEESSYIALIQLFKLIWIWDMINVWNDGKHMPLISWNLYRINENMKRIFTQIYINNIVKIFLHSTLTDSMIRRNISKWINKNYLKNQSLVQKGYKQ